MMGHVHGLSASWSQRLSVFLYFIKKIVYDPNHDLQETNRVVSNV